VAFLGGILAFLNGIFTQQFYATFLGGDFLGDVREICDIASLLDCAKS
jgi:hypothetical protein